MSDTVGKSEDLLLKIGWAHKRLRRAGWDLEGARSKHNVSPVYIEFQRAQKAKKEAQAALDRLMTQTFQMAQLNMGEVLSEVAHQVNEEHVMDLPEVRVTAQVREE